MILKSVLVPMEIYENRLEEEFEIWRNKQEMACSPFSLIRDQSEFINSKFTIVQQKIIDYRHKLT